MQNRLYYSCSNTAADLWTMNLSISNCVSFSTGMQRVTIETHGKKNNLACLRTDARHNSVMEWNEVCLQEGIKY